MILYYSPGTCSLAVRIALLEADMSFDSVAVDLQAKRTQHGEDFLAVNPKGYVPALVLDDGTRLTEMVSALYWVETRGQSQSLPVLDMLACLATEVHKYFLVAFFGPGEDTREYAQKRIQQRYDWLSTQFSGQYLFSDEPTVADIYLYTTTRWSRSEKLSIRLPKHLEDLSSLMESRAATREALQAEDLA